MRCIKPFDACRFNEEDAEYSRRRDKLLQQLIAEEQEALRLAEHRRKHGNSHSMMPQFFHLKFATLSELLSHFICIPSLCQTPGFVPPLETHALLEATQTFA